MDEEAPPPSELVAGPRDELPAEDNLEPSGGIEAEEPDSKRARTEDAEFIDLNYARTFDEAEFGYVMNIDLEFDSHRKIKRFLRAPAAFLVQQVRDCEVRYERLAPNRKVIFDRAKHKEVHPSSSPKQCANAWTRRRRMKLGNPSGSWAVAGC